MQELRDENAELKTGGGRLAFLLEEIFAPRAGSPKKQMQRNYTRAMQGHEPKTEDVSAEEVSDLEWALGILVEALGEEEIIQFAEKINAGEVSPATIMLLKEKLAEL